MVLSNLVSSVHSTSLSCWLSSRSIRLPVKVGKFSRGSGEHSIVCCEILTLQFVGIGTGINVVLGLFVLNGVSSVCILRLGDVEGCYVVENCGEETMDLGSGFGANERELSSSLSDSMFQFTAVSPQYFRI